MQFFNKHCVWGTFLTLLPALSQAQVSQYAFSQSAGTYTPITTGTSFTMTDNALYTATIPSFSFNGANYTSLTISTNGFIKFGTIAYLASSYSPISNTLAGTGGAVAAFARDLDTAAATGGTSSIRIDTAIGNEIVIQWQDVRRYNVSGERFSTQVRLNKTNGEIKVVYGGTITPGSNSTYSEVGLRGAANTDYNNRSVLSSTGAWLNSVAGTTNAATCYFNSATPATVPSTGLTFTWTPPSCFIPVGLAASVQSGTTANFSWTTSLTNGQIVVVPQGSAASVGTPSAVSGTTATISSLTPSTAYSVYIRRICGAGDTSAWSAAVNFTAACPNTTGLAASVQSGTTANFSWTTSLANGQIVVVPQGSAASVGTPSAVSGTTATVSSLTPSTAYSVYIRRICGAGDTSAWSAAVNFTVVCANTTGLAASVQSGTTANFSWTTSLANGQIVVVPQGSAASVGTPSAVSGTTATVSSLTPSTAYSVYIRRICGAGDTSAWSSVVNFTAACPNTTGLAVSSAAITSANFSWTTSLPNGQIVVVPQGSAASVGTPSAVSGTTATVSSLTPSTAYSVYIRRICGAGDTSAWSSAVNFATLCPPVSLPWAEGFESLTVTAGSTTLGAQPNCWARIGDVYGANGALPNNRFARTGTKYAHINYSTTAGTGDWMFTPAFNLTAGTSYDFTFWYATDGLSGWDTLRVGLGTSQSAAAMNLIGTRIYAATNMGYQRYKVTFTPSATGVYYLGVNVWAIFNPYYMSFDDFNVNVTPSCQDPIIALNTTTSTSATFSWSPAITSGQISVMPRGTAPVGASSTPVSGSTTTISGLTPGANYTAYIRSICAPGDTTTWASSVNFTAMCPNSTGLAVTTTTLTSATFSWTTSQTGQIVVVPQGSPASVGTPSAISGTTATVSGLTQSTLYSVYIRNICGAGDTSAWSSAVNFATQCGIASLPWTESFESINVASGSFTLGAQPACWAKIGDVYGGNGTSTYNRAARTGTKYASIEWGTTAGTGDWMFTPAFNLTAGTSYDFSFWYVADGYSGWDTLRVGFGTSQTAAAMTIIGTRVNAATNTSYVQYKVSFTPSSTGTYYMGVNVWANSVPYYMTFDDFNVNVTPPCVAPTLATGTITPTTAAFSWSSAVTTGQIVVVPQGSAASVGTPSAITGTTATVGSLTANTNYTAYIRKICAVGDTSTWSIGVNFSTPCNIYTTPWTESFETLTLASATFTAGVQPACWAKIGDVFAGNGATTYNRAARTGTKYASINYSTTSVTGDWMFTPAFNLTAGTSYDFTFWYVTDGLSGWDTIRVGVGSSQSAASMNIIGTRINSANNTIYQQYRVSFVPSTTGAYHFGVNVWAGLSPWYVTFDDFNVDVTPACPQPSALTTVSVGADTAVIRWTSNAPGSSWYVYYGTAGATPGSNQGTLLSDTTTILRGLSPNTSYNFYVREYCSVADTSFWTGPFNFTTNCAASTPGDSMATAINVNTTSYTTSGSTTRCFTNTIGNTSPDVWYRVVLDPCATQISASLCTGTSYDSYLRIYNATGTTLLASNDDGCSSQSVITNLNISAHDTVYVVVEGFGTATGAYGLTINQTTVMPAANISYAAATYCQNATTNPLPTNTGTTGGTFTVVPNTVAIDAISGELSLASGQPATSYNVLYTVGQPGCRAVDTFAITINAPDSADFSYTSNMFCSTVGNITPTITGMAGGAFSASNSGLIINTSTGVIDAAASLGGSYTVAYQTNGACPARNTVAVRIDTLQDASFAYGAPTVCENVTTQTVTLTGMAGGVFTSSTGLVLDSLTGDIFVQNSAIGTYVVTYALPNACASFSTDTFTILAMDDASFSYVSSTFCQNANNPSPIITGLTGGSFSSNTGLPVDIGLGIIDLRATTTGTLHTVIYATNGVCPNYSIVNVEVLPADTAAFSYPASTFCLTNNISVVTPSITGSTGGTFSAASGLMLDSISGGFHIDMVSSLGGTYTIMYVTNGPTTCPDTASATVTLNTCVGVTEATAQQGFEAYPNPNDGAFVLQNNGDDAEIRLHVVDALGRVVYQQENIFISKGGNTWIQTQSLAAGAYFVRVWTGNSFTTIPLQVITR